MDEEIKKEIVNAHWNAFTNQDSELQALHEYIAKDSEYYDEEEEEENRIERMENLGLDIISLTKQIWGESSTDFVVGLMVTITTESQLSALVEHLLNQLKENK